MSTLHSWVNTLWTHPWMPRLASLQHRIITACNQRHIGRHSATKPHDNQQRSSKCQYNAQKGNHLKWIECQLQISIMNHLCNPKADDIDNCCYSITSVSYDRRTDRIMSMWGYGSDVSMWTIRRLLGQLGLDTINHRLNQLQWITRWSIPRFEIMTEVTSVMRI